MSAQPGWYDAGIAGRQRWWDGTRWTEHERLVQQTVDAAAAPSAADAASPPSAVANPPAAVASSPAAAARPPGAPLGWYLVPGTPRIRWWDGRRWTPFELVQGRSRPDPMAIEPPAMAFSLGALFFAVSAMQFVGMSVGGGFAASGVVFALLGVLMMTGGARTFSLQKLAPPQTAPVFGDAVRPLPGDQEGPGAGWYPVAGQVSRWWTGARWSWYIAVRHGVRPGFAGPRGYLVQRVLGWVLVGIGVLSAAAGIALAFLPGALGVGMLVFGLVFGILMLALGVFVLITAHVRRFAFVLPPGPPPVR